MMLRTLPNTLLVLLIKTKDEEARKLQPPQIVVLQHNESMQVAVENSTLHDS